MRKNISEVIDAFMGGRAKAGKTCSTDGTTVWSYTTVIARRLPNGLVWVAPERSSTATTNGQIRAIRSELERVEKNLRTTKIVDRDCEHTDCHGNAEMMIRCVRGEAKAS